MGTAMAIATSTGRMGLVDSEGSIHLPASQELRQARRAALDGQIFLPGPCVLRSESLLAGVTDAAGVEGSAPAPAIPIPIFSLRCKKFCFSPVAPMFIPRPRASACQATPHSQPQSQIVGVAIAHTRRGVLTSVRSPCSVCWVCGMWSPCGGDNAQPSTVRFILNSKLILRSIPPLPLYNGLQNVLLMRYWQDCLGRPSRSRQTRDGTGRSSISRRPQATSSRCSSHGC